MLQKAFPETDIKAMSHSVSKSGARIMKTSQRRRAVKNRCIFSARLKALSDRSGDRSAGGRRFHVAGPLTAKLRCPVAVRARGTSRVPVSADRRCWRPEMAVAGTQRLLVTAVTETSFLWQRNDDTVSLLLWNRFTLPYMVKDKFFYHCFSPMFQQFGHYFVVTCSQLYHSINYEGLIERLLFIKLPSFLIINR